MKNESIKFNKNKIILSGGGTGGSVTPLLQIYKDLKNDFDFLFVGTYSGVEREIVKKEGLIFKPILSGKWRRYFSFKNFIDIFKIFLAFWQSLVLIIKEKPKMIISVGGFVAVPLSLSAWFFKIPIIVHQQDVIPGLANKLMSKIASAITVTFPSALKFYGKKAKWIGNLGPELNNLYFNKEKIIEKYKINQNNLPLVLILGGGTGSLFLNKLISETISELSSISQVIHVSGKIDRSIGVEDNYKNYLKIDFIDHQDLLALMFLSSLVISRCGLGTLTELSFFKKPSILIPMPNSHQEYNALEFEKSNSAIVLHQKNLNTDIFINEIKNILFNEDLKNILSNNICKVIKNGNREMITIIKTFFT